MVLLPRRPKDDVLCATIGQYSRSRIHFSLACRIDYIVTASGAEALLLEASLIKQHQPPFNVLLKDDKRNCEGTDDLPKRALQSYQYWYGHIGNASMKRMAAE